ncbi:MAG: HlyD family efflux transporter periplasmic adaptor subunit [Ichthyobacteriaceae bacterium]|nr:HlyD family efflux transporter periplasmic adaptor subunit [Ichthyobacteriaceae bacterium]
MKLNVRKTWVIAVIVLVVAVLAAKKIGSVKPKIDRLYKPADRVVFVQEVKNSTINLIVEGSGQLKAKNSIGIFTEVTGVLKGASKEFRVGTKYRKGELMLRVDDSEVRAQLFSSRSEFQNLITSILSDIKIDYPNEFNKWEKYLQDFNIEKTIKQLPKTNSKKEKYFITGRKVYTQYYAIKNLEAKHSKFNVRAKFNGIVTESNVNPGGLVRAGQKIGTFSNMDVFELELAVKSKDANYMNVGNTVTVLTNDKVSKWTATIKRINGAIDLNTQTVSVFIEVRGKGLKSGMYLDAQIEGKTVDNATIISRNLIHNNDYIYLVENSKLKEFKINAVRYNKKTVIVNNLSQGAKIVTQNVGGAFNGMEVKVNK